RQPQMESLLLPEQLPRLEVAAAERKVLLAWFRSDLRGLIARVDEKAIDAALPDERGRDSIMNAMVGPEDFGLRIRLAEIAFNQRGLPTVHRVQIEILPDGVEAPAGPGGRILGSAAFPVPELLAVGEAE